MLVRRTDLALEAKELWQESAGEQTLLPGVEAREKIVDGFTVTTVKILDERGEKELCKPIGTYVTIDLTPLQNRESDVFERGAKVLADELTDIMKLSQTGEAMLVGLGNPAITPDAIGPKTARHTLATRHLLDREPDVFQGFRPVSVLETGVLGTTGLESAEIIRSVAGKIRPECIVAVDALASRDLSRVCSTIQLADTGIVPGSGVGNSRAALNKKTLGIKVIAVGVPTVVDASTVAADLAAKAGIDATFEDFEKSGTRMIVTPRDIDAQVNDISRMVGIGINLALHSNLTVSDINMLVG